MLGNFYFNPNGEQFQVGEGVIVETSRGMEFAQCVRGNSMVEELELTAPLRPVVRKATAEDVRLVERNREREKQAFAICQEKIAEHKLDMKLVSAEYSFDGSQFVFTKNQTSPRTAIRQAVPRSHSALPPHAAAALAQPPAAACAGLRPARPGFPAQPPPPPATGGR